jgi:hypothetical protein
VGSAGDIRSERFYYDGSRRIQEVVLDPTESLAMALMSSDPQLAGDAMQSIAEQEEALTAGELDISAGSISFEAGQMEAGAFTAQGGIGNLPQQPMPEAHRLEREYIWGPGDSFAGVDELFVLFDRGREPWLVLQDASGDVAALCGRTSISQPAYVAAQWTWDAYGNVFSADHIFDHPFLSVGHKGLFVERLDVGVADATVPGSQYADTPRIVPFGHLIYHNRNRTYNPQQGRFLQLDMNASGVALMEAAAFNGRGMGALAVAFDMQTRYGDGANLYQYLGSSPWQQFDPMGLFFGDAMSAGVDGYGSDRGIADPFDMVDEYIAEDYGAKAAWLGNIMKNAEAGLDVLWTGLQMLPVVGQAASIYKIANGTATFWDYVGLVPVAGRGMQYASKLVSSYTRSARTYSLTNRIIQALCFSAGTLVTQADGSQVEIDKLRVGQSVLAWHDYEAIAIAEQWQNELDALVAYDKIQSTTWRSVDLVYKHDGGNTTMITLLRPIAWLEAVGAKPGKTIWLEIPELYIDGEAEVVCVAPIPAIDTVDEREVSPNVYQRTITGIFVTTEAAVLDLSIDGETKPLGVTSTHPFYSEDTAMWTAAGELQVGEQLRTLTGSAAVTEVVERSGTETVYNLEVRGSHTFYVGARAQLLVHNGYGPFPFKESEAVKKQWIKDQVKHWKKEGLDGAPAIIADTIAGQIRNAMRSGGEKEVKRLLPSILEEAAK